MDLLYRGTVAAAKVFFCVLVVAAMAVGGSLAIEEYQHLRDRPVIVRNETVNHPTNLEQSMATMLGYYATRHTQASAYVTKARREIERLEARERQLEEYITEMGLPTPASPQKTINLMILDN